MEEKHWPHQKKIWWQLRRLIREGESKIKQTLRPAKKKEEEGESFLENI